MKKNKKNIAQQTVLTAAALFALQGFPNLLHAQTVKPQKVFSKTNSARSMDWFLKINASGLAQQKMSLVAVMKGEPVFKNGKGELFRLNNNNGDIINVSKEEFAKLACCGTKAGGSSSGYIIKEATVKNSGKPAGSNIFLKVEKALPNIKVLGVDKDGHIIQETEKGEKFFLDPATGDMVDYNGHIAQYKQ